LSTVATIDPSIGVITQLMDEKMTDAQIILKQAEQIMALKAAVRVQSRVICLLTGLLTSSDQD
jgi:hypothetical protein